MFSLLYPVRKLLAAVVGMSSMLVVPEAADLTGTVFGMPADQVLEVVIALLTAFGVYVVPNSDK